MGMVLRLAPQAPRRRGIRYTATSGGEAAVCRRAFGCFGTIGLLFSRWRRCGRLSRLSTNSWDCVAPGGKPLASLPRCRTAAMNRAGCARHGNSVCAFACRLLPADHPVWQNRLAVFFIPVHCSLAWFRPAARMAATRPPYGAADGHADGWGAGSAVGRVSLRGPCRWRGSARSYVPVFFLNQNGGLSV